MSFNRKAYNAAYYQTNRQAALDRQSLYRKNNNAQVREGTRAWAIKYPERAKESYWRKDLKYIFGISFEEYSSLLEKQGGVCAICKRPPKAKKLGVDHCHETGVLRGLLCFSCNAAIGSFRDELDRLKAAVE